MLKRGLLAAAMVAFASTAHAIPVTWTLANVLSNQTGGGLDAGVSLSGSFTYNANNNTFSHILISLTDATTPANNSTFTTVSPGVTPSASGFGILPVALGNYTGAEDIVLQFASGLTNTGGSIALSSFAAGACTNATCTTSTNFASGLASLNFIGSVTTSPLPEPVSMALLGTGLVGIALTRRRRRTA